MSETPIQMEFDFSINQNTITVAKKEAKAKKPIRFPKNAVPITAVNWENAIVLDKGKRGLCATPLSMNAMQTLMLISKTGDGGERGYGKKNNSYVDGLLTYESIMNFGGLNEGSPIIGFFQRAGLEVVLTRAAHSYLDRKYKQFKRLMTPYKFHVPEQFTLNEDGQEEVVDTGGVEGPFVEDVYASEVTGYKKKIHEFGFDNPDNEFHLFPFQVDDIARLACKRSAFIGLEQGLGKTPISIALCHMHGHKRILVVCPGPAIGSWKSGWRHEIHRLGVPKANIHIMRDAEDLPFNFKDIKRYPDNGRPHFFITDYGTMSRDIIQWKKYQCPGCQHTVQPEDRGRCQGKNHPKGETKELKVCPQCYSINADKDDAWTGVCCNPSKGGCGWRVRKRVVAKGRQKKGITNALPMWKRIKRNMFQVGLFDESQMVKNAKTKRGRAVQHIPGLKRTYIITGTMMTNYIQDTFWQLNMLFRGKFPVLGSLKDYTTCKGHAVGQEQFLRDFQSKRGDKGRLPQLKNKEALWGMMSSIQIRRHAVDPEVDKQIHLPSLTLHTELIEMDEDHAMVYAMKTGTFQRELVASLQAAGQNVKVEDLNMVEVEQQINILRMVACAPEIEPIYRKDMTNKDARILELIEEGIANNSKTVVFSSFRAFTEKLQEMCQERGWNPIMIDGTVPIPKRWPMIDEWRTDPDRKVMIAGIKAMNYAVNFTAACDDFDIKTVIFATPEWVPTEMEQAWKRVHRIGQTKDVKAYFIYLKDTVEEYMDDVLYQKRRTIATAMDRIVDLQRVDEQVQRSASDIAKMILGLDKV